MTINMLLITFIMINSRKTW